MSGLFASLSVGRAWEKVTSFIKAFSAPSAPSSSCSSSHEGLEELEKLERTMHRVRAVLHDAELHWNIREESSKLKLQELKEVAYDMEDVVDEYEYEVNRCKVEALERYASVNNTNKRKRHEQNEMYSEDIGVVVVPSELVLRARKITTRFNEIVDFSDRFTLTENDGERRISHDISDLRHTSSFVFEKSILGRDRDRDKIVEKLLSDEGKNTESSVSVMAIVGMGGLGKTTLAQLVYNSPRMSKSFDKHAWVFVSESFNVNTITRNIIKSLTRKKCEITELADLQMKLADEIKDKKIFLVLDDVWNERSDCWDLLCRPMSLARICQIVVTTRREAVAKLVQTMDTYHMSCLTYNDSWSLFEQVAFSVNTPKKLKGIGKKIVQKCKGLPLAIKTVGSTLRFETDENIWEDVLENELFELEPTRNEVLPVLELCYKHMPICLRRCFIALSLYPKDSLTIEWDIISLWKSLDLLNCNGSYDEDETGSLYLKELVQRSILQAKEHFLDSDEPLESSTFSYNMHDLVHDLACFLSDGEFYRLEDTSVEIPQKVRYISVEKSIGSPILPHSLRAFIMLGYAKIINLESMFTSCKNLRALDLKVKHENLVEVLPKFIGSNFNYPKPYGIGHLINLRTLRLAASSCGRCGFNIRDLRNINKVRNLAISGLGGVLIEDANEAQMQSKRQLQSLFLDFNSQCDTCLSDPLRRSHFQRDPLLALVTPSHVQLLESLQPHCSLKELTIYNYWSHEYPSWLGNDAFSNLTRITLEYSEAKHLPPLGGLPSLKYLNIEKTENVEYIGREFIGHPSKGFPSLTDMEFDSMYKWLEWSGVDDSDFVRLNTLSIIDCTELKSLPSLPSLVNVSLINCDGIATIPAWSTLSKLRIDCCSSLSKIPTLPSLLDLYVRQCFNLAAVDSQPSLTSMELDSIDVYSVGFGSISSLASLKLRNGLQRFKKHVHAYVLNSLFYNLTSLECLDIRDYSATWLRLKQQSLPSLIRLRLVDCKNLQYCDGLDGLTCLQHLEVRGCPKFSTNDLHLPQLKTLIMEDE